MDFKGKKVSVIGAARSGLASVEVLKKLGAVVFLSEINSAEKFPDTVGLLKKQNIMHEFGGHSQRVYDCSLMVTSPGVPADSDVLSRAVALNIKVISELELGFLLCRGKVLAITGSNGKTTTTSLVGEIFRQAQVLCEVAGNIGQPFVSVAGDIGDNGWAIVEVSTFQLEWIDRFKPKVAAVLNITPDHLDRHKSLDNYRALKLKIFANQNGTDASIMNFDDKILKEYKSVSQTFNFSTKSEVENGCYIEQGRLYLNKGSRKKAVLDVNQIGIRGPHNTANACAASACCSAAGIDTEFIAAGLKSFKGVEHRLEEVGLTGGVSFINDSKATNVDAVYWALQSVFPPIVLIAGGRDKGGNFEILNDLVKENVKSVVLIGEASAKIAAAFEKVIDVYRAGSMKEAVIKAYELAQPNGTVLLSPGCASFDMFENFEHRGLEFKQAVAQLKKRLE